jgi:hypothetical protein
MESDVVLSRDLLIRNIEGSALLGALLLGFWQISASCPTFVLSTTLDRLRRAARVVVLIDAAFICAVIVSARIIDCFAVYLVTMLSATLGITYMGVLIAQNDAEYIRKWVRLCIAVLNFITLLAFAQLAAHLLNYYSTAGNSLPARPSDALKTMNMVLFSLAGICTILVACQLLFVLRANLRSQC